MDNRYEFARDSDRPAGSIQEEREWKIRGGELTFDTVEDSGVASRGQEPYTARMGANSHMIGGDHYKVGEATGKCPHCHTPIEHWDWAANLRGLEYAATKYIARWRSKGGIDSLKKAIHYCQKLIEIHAPWITVSINYANHAEQGGPVPAQPPQEEPRPTTLGSLRAEACYSQGVAGQESAQDQAIRKAAGELRKALEAGYAVLIKLESTRGE